VIANIGEMFWPKICAAVQRPELGADQRYDTNSKRVARRAEVDALLTGALVERTVALAQQRGGFGWQRLSTIGLSPMRSA